MSKPLIYIDQNIIGMQLDGSIDLTKCTGLCLVYSKEHFAEIRRSVNANRYLEELEKINAKLIDLELIDWKITGRAKLIKHGTPSQHYDAYLNAIDEVEFDQNLFDPFQAWVNGGGDEGLFKQLPEKIAEQVLSLTTGFQYNDEKVIEKLNALEPDFKSMIEQMIDHGNDVKKYREAFGYGKGVIGCISGKNQIDQIWNIIGPACPEISCDRFFGFDPIDKQGYESWPAFLGIVGCCAVMDMVGFQAEKKCRKLHKIPNVRSDSGHIGMGSFCSAILSVDKRLIKRAKAIYEYKNIGTSAVLLKRRVGETSIIS